MIATRTFTVTLLDAISTLASSIPEATSRAAVVSTFQTGSGTSTNMNANEVIANRAIELLGGHRGERSQVHPNDHVNLGQSSNDVIPSVIQIAAAAGIGDELMPALEVLERSPRARAEDTGQVVKTRRTHRQDATPIRLGQECLGWAGHVERCRRRCDEALAALALFCTVWTIGCPAGGSSSASAGAGTSRRWKTTAPGTTPASS